ncbi:MAG: hypothetical protein Q9195_003928 [Heterodermia aff. obscurata]
MGKKGNKRFRGGRGGGGQRTQRTDYTEIPKQNDLFEQYYNELGILQDIELDEFWNALRRDLPNSFRFTGSRGHAIHVQQRLIDHYVPEISGIEYERTRVDPPTAIPWFPDQLAWQMTTPKNVVRRFPPFASFQKFLVSETSVGNISRQEAVSMIPPLLMTIKPGMIVLDLCAAPGSKTAQLIEMVHGGEEARMRDVVQILKRRKAREQGPNGNPIDLDLVANGQEGDWSDDGRSTGLVIANDADYKRAQMLVHQVKRLSSPNLIVTNHDATMFPSIKIPQDGNSSGDHLKVKYLKFDRILADVPCSGDGTCRKNVNVWKDWTPGNALGLFLTQVRILVRALQMLKVGGRVIYSTCSMNPVENEAVIATAIERCGGLSNVELVDISDALPKLQTRPGLSSWDVMDKTGRRWQSWREVEALLTEDHTETLGRLHESMFSRLAETEPLPLKRCMRIYPHLQDTGGFFIAVLEKRKEIRTRPESEVKKIEPKPSIIAAVDEIEMKTANGTDPIAKIDALDEIAPPYATGSANVQSAAARQNQENAPNQPTAGQKREFHTEADATSPAKRLRMREPGNTMDDAKPQGTADRQVHWLPPPSQLEASRHGTSDLPEPALTKESQQQYVKSRPKQPFEEPFKYLPPDHPELESIRAFYRLSPRFPMDRFMVRNASGHPAKTTYYTSALARSILTMNEGKGIKFVHCGIKMFVRQDVQSEHVCKWRVQNEGLPLLEPWVGEERVVELRSRKTLRRLLKEMFPKVNGEGWKELGEIGERVRDIGMGCCVLRIEPSEGADGFRERMILPLWRSLYSLNLMLPKEDRRAMLLRLYNDDSPLLDHSKDRFETKARAPSDQEISDAETEAETTVAQAEKTQVEQARSDTILRDEDDDEDLEGGGVAIDPLAREGMATKAEGEESDAAMENYGTSTAANNIVE